MHWVIQSNLVGAEDVQRLRDALKRLGTPYTAVKLIPVVQKLENVPQIAGPVFVYGSTFVHRAAYNQGWFPGYVGGTQSYQDLIDHYGDDMLNPDAKTMPIKDVDLSQRPMFVRPTDDGKSFTGAVFDQNSWGNIKSLTQNHRQKTIEDDLVVVAPLREIFAEHRCLVVEGQVVTASTYRRGNMIRYDGRVDQDILDFAQSQVDHWSPDIGFAMDIAQTENGLKIVEINALSSSGFYACDLMKFADAINQIKHPCPKPSASLSPGHR